ncbi:MAG: hypothetical protein D3910_09530, partial [Candidatus Electrothrix sp. ATG2]|nr:hypothetical protein [Candidatus Electrothrix sp. ATG2]
SCLIFSKKTVNTGIAASECELISGIISPIIAMQHDDGEQMQLFRIRPRFYQQTQGVAELLGVGWNDESVIIKRFSGAVKWYMGVLRKAPRLDVPVSRGGNVVE